MSTIQFKSKIKIMYNVDNTVCYTYLSVPEFNRKHCNMHEFRISSKYGGFANSDLFKSMLKRIRSDTFKNGILRLDSIPDNVYIDSTGFLSIVTITVSDNSFKEKL